MDEDKLHELITKIFAIQLLADELDDGPMKQTLIALLDTCDHLLSVIQGYVDKEKATGGS